MESRIVPTVALLMRWLVAGEYSQLERYTSGRRLSAADLQSAVAHYGRKLVLPPESVFSNLEVVEVTGSSPAQWAVCIDLWTEEEGRSDLSLEVTLIDIGNELLAAELDNLHVL